mgnify:CR=1 FL=1
MRILEGETPLEIRVTRAILSFFGGLFSFLMLGTFFGALTVGGVIWVYTHDLPSTEQLANYSPPMISRIYSREGQLVDEFARERRLFTPIEDIPPLVRAAFISAEDRNFYEHQGFDPLAMASAARDLILSGGRNLRGAFMADPLRRDAIARRHVALVDDVMTTGATLHEAARVLLRAGAASVTAWVLARTPDD